MKSLILINIVIIFCSCSKLTVSVKTADPDELKKIAEKIDPYQKLAFDYRKLISPLMNTKILTERDRITRQFEAKYKSVFPNSEQDTLVGHGGEFQQNYTLAIEGIFKNFEEGNRFLLAKDYENAFNNYSYLPGKFEKLSTDLDSEDFLLPEQKQSAISEITTKLNAVRVAFHGGRANLLGDAIVSYITMKEHEKIWKSAYNKTVSRTYFGNADIAVVLNEMPDSYNNNYSIKGVRVDAAKLIQSSFDVMTQVVNVAATMSGIVPSSNEDTNSFYPDEFDEIKTLPIKAQELQNRNELLRELQKQLLMKILGENMQKKDLDDLQTSAASIKSFWDSNKVNLTSTPKTAEP